MKVAESRITAQGQVSIPADIRRRLGLGPGSVIEWSVGEGNLVFVRRAGRTSTADVHAALFARTPARRSLAALKEGIRKHARSRHARG